MRYSEEKWKELANKMNPEFNLDKSHYVDSYHKVEVICPHKQNVLIDPISFIKFKYTCTHKATIPPKSKKTTYLENYWESIVTYKENGFKFIKIGSGKEPDSNSVFDYEIISSKKCSKKQSEQYIEDYSNSHERFFLPDGYSSENTFLIDGYSYLKYNQVKFYRDCLLSKQSNICLLCEAVIDMPALDHYHSKKQHGSGLVRGVICNTCNRMVGVIENNFARNSINYSDADKFLIKTAWYLINKREPFYYPTEKEPEPVLSKNSYKKLVKAVGKSKKVPKYSKKLNKALKLLFDKYNIKPDFNKQ